jgi:hypothetical protein
MQSKSHVVARVEIADPRVVADQKKPDRDAILARRRFFVASAMAGVVVAACDRAGPQVCLEQMPPPTDAGPSSAPDSERPPQPCLEIPPPVNEDAGSTTSVEDATDAGKDAGKIEKPPQPCLTPMRPRDAGPPAPPPQVCLKVAPPKGGP